VNRARQPVDSNLVRFTLVSFCLFAALFGLTYLLLVPPMQVPDEFAHLFRIYEVSRGACLADQEVHVPVRIAGLTAKYPGLLERHRRVSLAGIWKGRAEPNDESAQRNVGYQLGSLYNCVPYISASIGLAIARALHSSALIEMYAGRLANLIVYVFLSAWAIRLMPGYRLLLTALALMPMSLHQAASLSVDALAISISFVFCAYILKLAFDPETKQIRAPQLAILAILTIVSTSCRFNVSLLLLLFLIPVSKFSNRTISNRTRRFTVIGLYFGLAFSVAFLWQWLNRTNLALMPQERLTQGIVVQASSAAISHHPFQFLKVAADTLADKQLATLAGEFVGRLGYLSVYLPYWAVLSYLILLLALALSQSGSLILTIKQKFLLAIIVVSSAIGLCAVLWTLAATPDLIAHLGDRSAFVPGLQGRYFISFCLPAFMLLSNRRMRAPGKPVIVCALLIIGIVNLSAVAAIWNTYYSSTPRNLAGGAQRSESPIFGNVDAPKEGSVVSQTCTVSGWAVASGSSVTKVGVYIDGRFEQEAEIGRARPDVQGVFPDEPGAPNSGFAAELNVAHLPAGDHILTVQAETTGGDVANVGTVRIRVAK
jgi:uncharacterized membrane protein